MKLATDLELIHLLLVLERYLESKRHVVMKASTQISKKG
jgi:hypothetical protein